MRLIFLHAAAALTLAVPATAQTTQDEQVWLNLTVQGPIDGVEVTLFGQSTAELGYLNQMINQAAGRMQMNHVASISVFIRH